MVKRQADSVYRAPDVRVLRHRDALQKNEARTPVTQVYYTIQLLITGDLDEEKVLPALRGCLRGLERCGLRQPIQT